jgi:hypothetical protein
MQFNINNVIFVLLLFFSIFSFFVAALLLFAFKDNEKYSATSFAFGCFLAGCATLAISFKSTALADFPYRLGLLFTSASWVGFYYSFKILLGEKISFKALAVRASLFAFLYVLALKLIGYFLGVDSLPYFVAASGIAFNFTLAFWDIKVYKRFKLIVALALATTHVLSTLGYLFIRFPEEEGLINLLAYGFLIALVMVRYVGMFSLLASVETMTKGEVIAENHLMRAELANKKAEQTETQLLSSLNALAKARDDETGNHIIRTQNYVRLLALRLRNSGHYIESLSDQSIELLFKAAPLHDIGKVGIPDRILLKNGRFTDDEWTIMKNHALIGESVLSSANTTHEGGSEVIAKAIKIAGGHHEKWDGTGYPRGLAGEDIPLEARVMSLADMYDALLSERPYKKAWTHEEAVTEIISRRDTQFDPLIVDAFIAEQDAFKDISAKLKD